MQLKFHNQSSFKQTMTGRLIKLALLCLAFVCLIFLLDKFNFPSPQQEIKKDITNEIIKLN
jgi:hypothetical protein